MSDPDDTNQILREIRDAIRAHNQEASEARKALRDIQSQRKRGLFSMFILFFVALYFAVYLALVSVKYIGGGLPH